jgi:hypothetical protein
MQNCPWCGRTLDVKYLDLGHRIRHVCGRCGFKIKEYDKPEPKKVETKPEIIEIRDHEVPTAKQTPAWPFILGGIVLILIIIVLIKIFLV